MGLDPSPPPLAMSSWRVNCEMFLQTHKYAHNIRTHTHMHMHTHTHSYTHKNKHPSNVSCEMPLHAHTYTHTSACTHAHTHARTHTPTPTRRHTHTHTPWRRELIESELRYVSFPGKPVGGRVYVCAHVARKAVDTLFESRTVG